MYLDLGFHARYPFFVEFLNQNRLLRAVAETPLIMRCLKKLGKQNEKYFRDALIVGNDPKIIPSQLQVSGLTPNNSPTTRLVRINRQILNGHHWSKICEKSFRELPSSHEIRKKHPKPQFSSAVWEEISITTLLHELVHYANNDKGFVPPDGVEQGFEFERCAGLKTPSVPDLDLEDIEFWGQYNTIDNPLFPMTMSRV